MAPPRLRAGLQETPFRFTSAAQLIDTTKLGASGRPHRGPSLAPVFVLNRWVDINTYAASVSGDPQGSSSAVRASADVSAYPHHLPNLIAVDFYRRADVFGVVDALNGECR